MKNILLQKHKLMIVIILGILFISGASLIYAANGGFFRYRISPTTTFTINTSDVSTAKAAGDRTIEEWNVCKIVTNSNSGGLGDAFIPTKTSPEWGSVTNPDLPLATALSVSACPSTPPLYTPVTEGAGCSCTYSSNGSFKKAVCSCPDNCHGTIFETIVNPNPAIADPSLFCNALSTNPSGFPNDTGVTQIIQEPNIYPLPYLYCRVNISATNAFRGATVQSRSSNSIPTCS